MMITTYTMNFQRFKAWMRRQRDMKRRIRATCKKYNISTDGNYMTWVNLEFDLYIFFSVKRIHLGPTN